MKKSTLLSLLTATSIILTSAGTYAAWDKTEHTVNGDQITLRSGVTVSLSGYSLETNGDSSFVTSDDTIKATGSVNLNVANPGTLGKTVKLTPSLAQGSHESVELDDLTISIKKDGSPLGKNGQAFIDTGVNDQTEYTPNYTIEITPNGDDALDKTVKIDLKAELVTEQLQADGV